jgi:hypothetical protein
MSGSCLLCTPLPVVLGEIPLFGTCVENVSDERKIKKS